MGAQITSTQAAVDQHLNVVNAPSIEYADVQNKLETQGQAYSVSVTLGTTGPGFSGGVGHIDDHDTSVSRAGISGINGLGGQDSARTGDASTSLQNDFDASKAQAKLAAQVSITQTLSKEAPQAVANFAKAQMDQAAQQYEAAGKEPDPQAKAQMQKDALDKIAAWDEGGRYRVAMHMAMGAAGAGWQGAIGAGAAATAAPTMDQLQKNLRDELTPILGDTAAVFVSQGLIQLTTSAAGATLGGMQGAQWATTVDVNNRQLHPLEADLIRGNAAKYAAQRKITRDQAETELTQQTLRQEDSDWAKRVPDNPEAGKFLSSLAAASPNTDVGGGNLFDARGTAAYTDHTINAEALPSTADLYNRLNSTNTKGIVPNVGGAYVAYNDAANDQKLLEKTPQEILQLMATGRALKNNAVTAQEGLAIHAGNLTISTNAFNAGKAKPGDGSKLSDSLIGATGEAAFGGLPHEGGAVTTMTRGTPCVRLVVAPPN